MSRYQRRMSTFQYLFGGGGGWGSPALKFPDGEFRGVVDHPGSSGKRPWEIAGPGAINAAAVTWTRAGRRRIAKHLAGG